MVQKSASCQFAFWPDYCIASSRRSLPITVRLIAFQKRDWKYIHTYNTCCRSCMATMRDTMPRAKALGNNYYSGTSM